MVRKTVSARILPWGEELKELKLRTHVPTKYVLVDTETGDVWAGAPPWSGSGWRKATLEQIGDAVLTIKMNKGKQSEE